MSFKNILNLRAKSDLKFEMIDNNFIERVNIEYYLKLVSFMSNLFICKFDSKIFEVFL